MTLRDQIAEAAFYAMRYDDWGVANEDEKEIPYDVADAVLKVIENVYGKLS